MTVVHTMIFHFVQKITKSNSKTTLAYSPLAR